jgi:hypothetical protein
MCEITAVEVTYDGLNVTTHTSRVSVLKRMQKNYFSLWILSMYSRVKHSSIVKKKTKTVQKYVHVHKT